MKTLNISFQNRHGDVTEMAVNIPASTPFSMELEAVKNALYYAEIFDFRSLMIQRKTKKVIMMAVECGGMDVYNTEDTIYDCAAPGY